MSSKFIYDKVEKISKFWVKSYFRAHFPVSLISAIFVFVPERPFQYEYFDSTHNKIGPLVTQILTKIWKFIELLHYWWAIVVDFTYMLYKVSLDLYLWYYWWDMVAGFSTYMLYKGSSDMIIVLQVVHIGGFYYKCHLMGPQRWKVVLLMVHVGAFFSSCYV